MRVIPQSELIINHDGSVFHLHMRPRDLADTVVLVGDPARVEQVAAHFDAVESRTANREFHSATGTYKGRRVTALSHGIGPDNIDIVVTELDALANVDFGTRRIRPEHRRLTLLRLGTSGALQDDLEIGDAVFARTSAGFDGVLNFYAGALKVCDADMEDAFVRHTAWNPILARPYFVHADEELYRAFRDVTREGITVSSPGFYGPQGRHVRLAPAEYDLNERISSFEYHGRRIMNYEMESAPLAGLARMLGHRAATICTVIAQRRAHIARPDYRPFVEKMIKTSLDILVEM